MKKNIIIMAILILIVGLVFYFFYFLKKDNNIITLYGNVEIRQVDLSFQVSGIIENVFVEEGDFVKKGQVLAKIEDKDYKINYKKAIFKEKQSRAKAKEDSSKFKRNYPLCFDDIVSKEECETLLNNKNSSNATNAEDRENILYQKNQLEYTTLYAPNEGIISSRVQEKGARVDKGQTIYVMNLTKPIWIRSYIKETDLGNVKYGMNVKVKTDTIDPKTNKNKEYNGKIGYISPVAEFSPKTVQSEDLRVDLVYRIRVYVDDSEIDEYLRQGMPTTLTINLKENYDK